MRRGVLEVMAAVRNTLGRTFVEPVQSGHPRPRDWPRGLPAVGAAALVIYVLLGVAAIFAVPLRQRTHLVISPATGSSLPDATIWLLLSGVILSFALVHTAALHTSWLWRIALFVLGVVALFFFAGPAMMAAPWAIILSVLSYAGLFLFTLLRATRSYAWWEFVVVTAIVAFTMLSPWLVAGLEIETRVVAIEGAFSSLGILSLPALLVAGSAPAQIALVGAVSAAPRPFSRRVFIALSGLAIAWLVISTVLELLQGSEDLSPAALAAGIITLVIMAGLIILWLTRGRQPQPQSPAVYSELWSSWLYPLATAIMGILIVAIPVQVAIILLRFLGVPHLDGVSAAWNAFFENNGGLWWRAGIGVFLLIVAWRISARGRVTEATLISALSVLTILSAVGLLPGLTFLHEGNPRMNGLLAAAVALVAGGVLRWRRQLDRRRATWIMVVVLLAVLYPFRNFLGDPAGAALGFSAQLLVIFGLTWRLLTDTDFLEGDTPAFPRTTRVLLFFANSLFAATSVAFVGLARATATAADTTNWVEAGDWLLGEPLFLAGLVTALWLVLRPGAAAVEPVDPEPSDDPSVMVSVR